MKKIELLMLGLILGAVAASPVLAQGPLVPPGPPGPVYKSLDEIYNAIESNAEAVIDVAILPGDATNLHIISAPGSYRLSGNLTGEAGKAGIQITASNVTLDLRGFTLEGVLGAHNGIIVSGAQKNIHIRNGQIVGWGAISVGGIEASTASSSSIVDVSVTGCGEGPSLGESSLMERVQVANSLGDGIWIGDYSVIRDSTVTNSGYHGFSISRGTVVENSVATNNGSETGDHSGFYTSFDCVLVNCIARSNVDKGFSLQAGSIAENCNASSNGQEGFLLLEKAAISNSLSEKNQIGIRADLYNNRIVGNTVTENDSDEIIVNRYSTVENNICSAWGVTGRTGAGIRIIGGGNRIISNQINENEDAIIIEAGRNLIVQNTLSGNDANISVTGTNIVGTLDNGTSPSNPYTNFLLD